MHTRSLLACALFSLLVIPVGLAATSGQEMHVKLLRIVIPEIEINDAPIDQVFDLLSEFAAEIDRDPDASNRGINFMLALDEKQRERLVSIKGKKLNMLEILHQISASGRVMYAIRDNVLIVSVPSIPKGLYREKELLNMLAAENAPPAQEDAVEDTWPPPEPTSRLKRGSRPVTGIRDGSSRIAEDKRLRGAPKPATRSTLSPNTHQIMRELQIERSRVAAANKRLKGLVLPSLALRETLLEDAARIVEQTSKEHDPSQHLLNVGYQILLDVPPSVARQTLTFQAREISLYDALRALTRVTGTTFGIRGRTIVISSSKTP